MTRLLVVVVNYKTPDLTIDCLRSLAPEVACNPGTKVVVVDNASLDGSAEKLRAALVEWGSSIAMDLVVSERNRGFAGGTNLGIARGEPAEYILLLNSDSIVHAGCLRRCLEVMDGSARIGAMSCRVMSADGSIQTVTRRFPTPLRLTVIATGLPWAMPRLFGWADTEEAAWDRQHGARDVEWIGGAFLLIRSSVFDGRVRLDEDFFFYGEDIELCHRIRRRGYSLRYDPAASILHLGGASSDPSRLPSSERMAHQWSARYLVQRKCWGALAARWLYWMDLFASGVRLARERLRGASGRAGAAELEARIRSIQRYGR